MNGKVLGLIVIGLGLSAFSSKHSLKYSGTASDLTSGQFYYTEEHEEWQNSGEVVETFITFKDNTDQTIVKKKIDYSKNGSRPDFLLEDLRDGYLEGAESKGEYTELKYRKNSSRKLETKLIRIPEPAVVDGGFNHFVKSKWSELMEGKRIVFHFAVPSAMDYFTFRVSKVEEKNFSGKNAVIFKMEPDQLILRSLVQPIILTYNISTKRLMQYEGISNINDLKGKSYKVKIRYPQVGP